MFATKITESVRQRQSCFTETMKILIEFASQEKEILNLKLWFVWLRLHRLWISIIRRAFDQLNLVWLRELAEQILLLSIKQHYKIDNEDLSVHIVISICCWQQNKEDCDNVRSFHKYVLNSLSNEMNRIKSLCVFSQLHTDVLYWSDSIVICLNLSFQILLLCFAQLYDSSFSFLILIMNRVIYCLMQKLKAVLNTLKQFILTVNELFDFWVLTENLSLFVSWALKSLWVDQLTHSVNWLN